MRRWKLWSTAERGLLPRMTDEQPPSRPPAGTRLERTADERWLMLVRDKDEVVLRVWIAVDRTVPERRRRVG